MKGHHKLLIGLLFIQLVLVIFLVVRGNNDSAAGESSRLVAFDSASITGIQIIDGEGAKLALQKSSNGWQIGSLPADNGKVTTLFETLTQFNASWPVATTEKVRARFEVSDDKFQRRLLLQANDATVVDLLFGTSPGFAQVHIRSADADKIYSVKFANYELSLKSDDWLDKSLLQPATPVAVEWVGHWMLKHADEGWLLDGTAVGQEAVTKLLNQWSSLQVLGIATEPGVEKARFNITTESGVVEYRLFHNEAADRYALSTLQFDKQFEIPGYIAEQLMIDRDELMALPANPPEDASASLVDETMKQLTKTQ